MEKFKIYSNNEERDKAIISMITFGIECFLGARMIEDLDKLIKIFEAKEKGEISLTDFFEHFQPYFFDWIIDETRIIICFENILKSQLLLNGYLVHELKNKKLFFENQEPIAVIKLINYIDNNEESSLNTLLTENTIPVSRILKKEMYFKHTSINLNIRNALSKMNIKRNQLHLLSSYSNDLNIEYFKNLIEMKNYVNHIVEKIKGTGTNNWDIN